MNADVKYALAVGGFPKDKIFFQTLFSSDNLKIVNYSSTLLPPKIKSEF